MRTRWILLAVILVQNIVLYAERQATRRAIAQMSVLMKADSDLKRADDKLQEEAAKVLRSCTGSRGLL